MKIIETIDSSGLVDILHSPQFLARMDKSIEVLFSDSKPVSGHCDWVVDKILGRGYNYSDINFDVPSHLLKPLEKVNSLEKLFAAADRDQVIEDEFKYTLDDNQDAAGSQVVMAEVMSQMQLTIAPYRDDEISGKIYWSNQLLVTAAKRGGRYDVEVRQLPAELLDEWLKLEYSQSGKKLDKEREARAREQQNRWEKLHLRRDRIGYDPVKRRFTDTERLNNFSVQIQYED